MPQENQLSKTTTPPICQRGFHVVVVVTALLLAGLTAGCSSATKTKPATQFFLGADVSALAAPARAGRTNRVYQEFSTTNEEWRILMNHGWTMFRLRVFVSPTREAPDNSLANTLPLAQRIKAAGGKFALCLHLSDTWADPQHQEIPVAWRGLEIDGLERAVEAHCHEVVAQLKAAGAMPDWVQVRNEITLGTLWPLARVKIPSRAEADQPESTNAIAQWENLTRILKAGIRGVKSAAGDTPPRIALHIDKGANWRVTKWFFDHVNAAHIEYDLIAESFYPEWNHGTLEQVWENLTNCAARYPDKDFAVVETGYGRSHTQTNTCMVWPETPEGRLQFMADIVNTVKRSPRGVAVMYWAPEREAWNRDGSPGPVVSVLDSLNTLTNRPASRVPTAVSP
jgi:arabinogalactan endo-1,4-beta-galactosidase